MINSGEQTKIIKEENTNKLKKPKIYFKKNGKTKKVKDIFLHLQELYSREWCKKGYYKAILTPKNAIELYINEDIEEVYFENCNLDVISKLIVKNQETKVLFHECSMLGNNLKKEETRIAGGKIYLTNVEGSTINIESETVTVKGRNLMDILIVNSKKFTLEGECVLEQFGNSIICNSILVMNGSLISDRNISLHSQKTTIINSKIESLYKTNIRSENLKIINSKIISSNDLSFFYDLFHTIDSEFYAHGELNFNSKYRLYGRHQVTSEDLTDERINANKRVLTYFRKLRDFIENQNSEILNSKTNKEKERLNDKKATLIEVRTEIKYLQGEYMRKKEEIEKTLTERKVTTFKFPTNAEEIITTIKENCPHPAWYFENGFTDRHEGRTYWTCKCVACGKRLEEVRSRDYPNDRVIWDECIMGDPTESKLSYKEVADKWVEFMENFSSEDKSIEEKGKVFTKMMNPVK